MFTGIVDHCGLIASISTDKNAIKLSITHQFDTLALGESICVDGICLTVTGFNNTHFQCDLSPETLALTRAQHYCVGDSVNLEKSLRLSDRLSGHIVTGHVDSTLTVRVIQKQDAFIYLEFVGIADQHQTLITSKGSICLNGVSLTINTTGKDFFSVMLIPHTLDITNLKTLREKSSVNVEYDYLAKLVQANVKKQLEIA